MPNQKKKKKEGGVYKDTIKRQYSKQTVDWEWEEQGSRPGSNTS
jgi:hypothetical protein